MKRTLINQVKHQLRSFSKNPSQSIKREKINKHTKHQNPSSSSTEFTTNTAHDYDFHRCCGIRGSVPGVGARGSSASLISQTQHITTPSRGDAIRASGASTRGLLCAARVLSLWHSGVGAWSRRQGVFRFVWFHNQHRHQARDVCVLLSQQRGDC